MSLKRRWLFDNEALLKPRRMATMAAMHIVGWPTAVAIAWFVAAILVSRPNEADIWSCVVAATIAIYAVIFVGSFCSWLSCQLVGRNNVLLIRMSIAIALIFDFAVFGWILVLVGGTQKGMQL